MAIRFVLKDRSTGEVTTVSAPLVGERVKDGVRHAIAPKQEEISSLVDGIRVITKLGQTGGCLASK